MPAPTSTLTLFRQQSRDAAARVLVGRPLKQLPRKFFLIACLGLAVVVGIVVWVTGASYTQRLRAQGVLEPAIAPVDIRAEFDASVSTLAVREGDRVKPGQLIAELVRADARTREEAISVGVGVSYTAQQAAIKNMRSLALAGFSEELRAIDLRRQALATESVLLAEELRLAILAENDAVKRYKRAHKLADEGHIARVEVDRLRLQWQTAQAETLGKRRLARQTTSRLKGQDTEERLARNGHLTRLAELKSDLNRVTRERIRHQMQSRQQIISPVHARVAGLTVRKGANINRGERVLQLLSPEITFEIRLLVTDPKALNASVGAPVVVRVLAYPYEHYGPFDGKVLEIADSPSANGQWLIRAAVTPRSALPLKPGMTVEVVLPVKRQRVLKWLLGPLERVRGTA